MKTKKNENENENNDDACCQIWESNILALASLL